MVGPLLQRSTMPLRRVPQLWLRLDGGGPLFGQIYRALKEEILTGRLAPGARLPSTRRLASDLGVSRNTTAPIYDQLFAEGYLVTRTGSGTYVAPELPKPKPRAPRNLRPRAVRLSSYGERLKLVPYPYDELGALEPARWELLYGVPEE